LKFSFRPAPGLEGSIAELELHGADVFTPEEGVIGLVAGAKGRVVRRATHSLTVDLEPADLKRVLNRVQGWEARPAQTSSSLSGFDGMLIHHFGRGTRSGD
jgi:hypothetical protein